MTATAPPIVEVYTQGGLNCAIWERVGGHTDRTLHEAIQLLYEALLKDGDWKELWRVFGYNILVQIEAAERGNHRRQVGIKDETPGESWRQGYKDGTLSCWDVVWPVGMTNIRKPLGEWTSQDLRDAGKWYASTGRTLVEKGSAFIKAAKEVGSKTLAEAKLTAETQEFFESMTRCKIVIQ